ncbi:MAG: peptide chain release factor N(5)-glutamine methyltransferase [Myxococcales bacterium]|nr:peptide chain release factor N(5)-glutamine methyltransferase [Myxococcales bacterium]
MNGGEGAKVWTIRRMLAWMAGDFAARGIPSSRLDAEVLLAHALALPRVKLYLDMERPLSDQELDEIRALIKRRRAREPVAYILGQREFYSRAFAVDPRVLVPRPETELLVDHALATLARDDEGDALDLGTGSGCIGITLAAERSNLRVALTDVSSDALAVAQANAVTLGVVERVTLHLGDLWESVPALETGYRLIVANPPYVRSEELSGLSPEVAEYEPHLALVAPEQGLSFYRRIAARAREFLSPTGHLLVEVGEHQAQTVRAAMADHFAHVHSYRDLGGIERVVAASEVAPPRTEEPLLDRTLNVDGVG